MERSESQHRIAMPPGTWRLDIFERACKGAAVVIGALLARLQPQPPTIHVADISQDWLTNHATETPKHADDR